MSQINNEVISVLTYTRAGSTNRHKPVSHCWILFLCCYIPIDHDAENDWITQIFAKLSAPFGAWWFGSVGFRTGWVDAASGLGCRSSKDRDCDEGEGREDEFAKMHCECEL